MTSLTEETVYTSLHYPRGSMNSHSPTDPLWTPYLSYFPWNTSETPWGSLTASLATPDIDDRDFKLSRLPSLISSRSQISLLVSNDRNETKWLASRIPHCPAIAQATRSSVTKSGPRLSCATDWDSPSMVQCILCIKQRISLKLNFRALWHQFIF